MAFNLSSSLYLPQYSESTSDLESNVVTTVAELVSFFEECKCGELNEEIITEIFSIIDASSSIVKAKERIIEDSDTSSKAYYLHKLEAEIANFDDKQKYYSL